MRLWKPDPYFLGAFTFAQMKALTGMPDGATVFCTSYPANKGSEWRYSSALSDWFPVAPCKVYEKTTVTDGLLQTADQVLLAIPLEANLIANKVLRVIASLGKDGTTDALGTMSFRMGAAGTTADTAVFTAVTSLSAAQRSIGYDTWLRMSDATTVHKLGGVAVNAWSGSNGSSQVTLDQTATIANVTTQTTYITITMTMPGTTNKPQIGYTAVEIQP